MTDLPVSSLSCSIYSTAHWQICLGSVQTCARQVPNQKYPTASASQSRPLQSVPNSTFQSTPHSRNFPLLTNQIPHWPANPHSPPSLSILWPAVQIPPPRKGFPAPSARGDFSHWTPAIQKRSTQRSRIKAEGGRAEFIHQLKCQDLPA